MKLHLTKGLRTALLACICGAMVSTTWAETITLPGSGNVYTQNITSAEDVRIEGSATRIGNTNDSTGLSINNTGTLTFAVTDTVEIGAWPGNSASPTTIGSNVTNVIIESGHILLTCESTMANTGSLTIAENAKFTGNTNTVFNLNGAVSGTGTLNMSGGTVKVTDASAISVNTREGYSNGNSGYLNATFYTLQGSVSFTGSGTLELTDGTKLALNNGTAIAADTPTYYVNDNLVYDKTEMGSAKNITISAGNTLTVNGEDDFPYNGTLQSIDLTGSTDATATLTLNAHQTLKAHLNLNGNTLVNGTGDFHSFGTKITAQNTNNEISTKVIVREPLTVDVKKDGELTISGALADNGGASTLTKEGAGKLVLSETASISSKNVQLNVTGGTLEVQKENIFAATQKVTLAGADKDNVATLKLSANQTMAPVNITLEGHTSIEGTGTATFSGAYIDGSYQGTKLTASGTNNTISANIAAGWNINLEVQENGKLTLTGSVTQADSGALVKTGTGTLALSSTATVANNVAIDHQVGILDLSDVTTLNASELKLAAGSTLVLGSEALTFTGTLKVADGAIIDLSAWKTDVYSFDDETLFTGVKGIDFLNGGTGMVYIDFGDGKLWQNWLYDAGDGKVNAIPEPATATLSLLALAGLVARRRRK